MLRRTLLTIGISLVSVMTPIVNVSAQAVCDFDGDGTSDILFTAATGTSLRWQSVPSKSGGAKVDAEVGKSNDVPAPGFWLSSSETSLAAVRTDAPNKSLVWKLLRPDGSLQTRSFGKSGDYIVSGGDFNGDGITDAAVMRIQRGRYRWSVSTSFFLDDSIRTKSFFFGNTGDRIFFANPDGAEDWVGVFGLTADRRRAQVVLRNIITGERRAFKRFPRRLALGERPRPLPLRRDDGADEIVFVTTDSVDTTLQTFDLTGTRINRTVLPGTGTVVLGDFLAGEAGSEVVLQTSTTLHTLNPFSGVKQIGSVVAGSPVDDFVVFETIAATPTPTPSPTDTPETP